MKKLILLLLLLPVVNVIAAGGQQLKPAQTNIRSIESLRNGAKYYMNYCSACHSLKYQRYSRMAKDLELSEAEVMNNLVFTGAKFSDHMTITMADEDSNIWFGKTPPDLTVIAKARGNDWLYAYLKGFYKDSSRPSGWTQYLKVHPCLMLCGSYKAFKKPILKNTPMKMVLFLSPLKSLQIWVRAVCQKKNLMQLC